MENPAWGLLGPDRLSSQRRMRSLNLGRSVRHFNELAVPGLGGVWFLKQVYLALLGVEVAARLRESGTSYRNILVANAIEALACGLSLENYSGDSRIRGSRKLSGERDYLFKTVKHPNFYVSQPMRMATVQTLWSLGLVDGQSARFNSFTPNAQGRFFLEACDAEPVLSSLTTWMRSNQRVRSIAEALSPCTSLPKSAATVFFNRFQISDKPEDARKRSNALSLIRRLDREKTMLSLKRKPPELGAEHWRDILAGAALFETRNLAWEVLDEIEKSFVNEGSNVAESVTLAQAAASARETITHLKESAAAFLADKSFLPIEAEATAFCRECNAKSGLDIVRALVIRDGAGMIFRDDKIVPGLAFRGSEDREEADVTDSEEQTEGLEDLELPLPNQISYRFRNLFLLNADANGKLESWIKVGERGA